MRVHLEIPADTIGGGAWPRWRGSAPTSSRRRCAASSPSLETVVPAGACARSAAPALGPDAAARACSSQLRRLRAGRRGAADPAAGDAEPARPGRVRRARRPVSQSSVVSRGLEPRQRGAPPEPQPSMSFPGQTRSSGCRVDGHGGRLRAREHQRPRRRLAPVDQLVAASGPGGKRTRSPRSRVCSPSGARRTSVPSTTSSQSSSYS